MKPLLVILFLLSPKGPQPVAGPFQGIRGDEACETVRRVVAEQNGIPIKALACIANSQGV